MNTTLILFMRNTTNYKSSFA